MKRDVHRYVLRLLGRFYEARSPQCVSTTRLSADDTVDKCSIANELNDIPSDSTTRWKMSDLGLKPGWYMLEIEHSLASIGCILTLDGGSADPEHLLLTSKAVCKRIIRLDAHVMSLAVSIDQPRCSLKRLALVALSQRFVVNRMRKRLENRGSKTLQPDMDVSTLYDAYRKQIDDSIFPGTYRPIQWVADTTPENTSVPAHLLQDTQLILHQYGIDQQASMDESVQTAIAFAQQIGWNITWDVKPMLFPCYSGESPGTRVFHTVVHSKAVYRPDVFHQLLSCIDEHSVLIYADHDHIDSHGKHFDPVLKPAWNPELLLNADYIQLPWIIENAWVQRVADYCSMTSIDEDRLLLVASLGAGKVTSSANGKALGLNGDVSSTKKADNRDAPLMNVLVETERVEPLANEQVQRVPQVLASIKAGELKACSDAKHSTESWHQKVGAALSGAGKSTAVASATVDGICRVAWALPAPLPMVDIIIPTRDKVEVLKACIDSVLQKTSYSNYRLLIVDNDSQEYKTKDYYDELEANSRVRLLHYAGDFNYSAINNYAINHSEAPLIVLLNNDTEIISPGWLDELAGQAMRDEIGCVGAKLYYSNGRLQHGGVIVGITGVAGHAHRYCTGDDRGYCNRLISTQNLVAVTAACLAIRRSTYLKVGGLDQTHLGVAWNDVDLCLKVQHLGYRNLWTPYAELFHHEGLSRGADDTTAKMMRVDAERKVMVNRWKLDNFSDPAYHPLLTRESEQFSLGRAIT